MSSSILIGETELTDGNLAHDHIYLSGFFDKFPPDAIGGSSKAEAAARPVQVEWAYRNTVETDLDGEKKFFRSRTLARRFFMDTEAEAGDRVLVTEMAPYRYFLSLRKGS